MGVNREIAIVTGAARGIGKATSLRFEKEGITVIETDILPCLLYTSPSPRDVEESRMPSSA